jgi:quinol monooxygenase YgiN
VAREGRDVTEAIWRDMTRYDGYIGHALIEDLDDPGHLLVVSQWESREHADETLRRYADDPNARRANELVARPRTRFVGHALASGR